MYIGPVVQYKYWTDCDILLSSSFIKKSRVWTILARHEDTLDEHLWFGMDFIRMSQSAALEWIEMLRGSNIDRAPLLEN